MIAFARTLIGEYYQRKMNYRRRDERAASEAGVVFTPTEKQEIKSDTADLQRLIDGDVGDAIAIAPNKSTFHWGGLPERIEKAIAAKKICSLAALHDAWGHTGVM